MKSSTVWHGHSTRPSLHAGTARKAKENLLHGRRNRLILQEKKHRKFPLGNFLRYISLLSVAFGRVRSYSGAHPVFVLPILQQIHFIPEDISLCIQIFFIYMNSLDFANKQLMCSGHDAVHNAALNTDRALGEDRRVDVFAVLPFQAE